MTMWPCRDCRLTEGCEVRENVRATVRGLGLTSLKFNCAKRREYLQPGQHVRVTLPYVAVGWNHGGPEDYAHAETEQRTIDAVVMKWNGAKVRIFVPEQAAGWLSPRNAKGPDERLDIVSVKAKCIEPVAGISVVCLHCGLPQEAAEKVTLWRCRPQYEPDTGADYDLGHEFPSELSTTGVAQ